MQSSTKVQKIQRASMKLQKVQHSANRIKRTRAKIRTTQIKATRQMLKGLAYAE